MSRKPIEIDFHFRSFVKVFAAAIIVACALKLWPLFILFAIALLVAVTLQPFRAWLSRRIPDWASLTLVSLAIIAAVGVFFGVLMPAIIGQFSEVAQNWPQIKQQALQHLPRDGTVGPAVQSMVDRPGIPVKDVAAHLLTVGGMAIGGLTELVLMLTLSVYLLVDGKRTYDWILAFFEPRKRFKLHQTAREVSDVISAYVAGQFITSLLVTVYAFAVLSILKVPAALVLAVVAGIFDILPIVGFFLSTIPAVLLALTVSPVTALWVFGAYLLYHGVENYFIVPRIYGNKLRLSTLVVLLALLAGGTLAGVAGAVLVLPIVASYPIIERIWLPRYLGPDVVEKHLPDDDDARKSA